MPAHFSGPRRMRRTRRALPRALPSSRQLCPVSSQGLTLGIMLSRYLGLCLKSRMSWGLLRQTAFLPPKINLTDGIVDLNHRPTISNVRFCSSFHSLSMPHCDVLRIYPPIGHKFLTPETARLIHLLAPKLLKRSLARRRLHFGSLGINSTPVIT